HEMKVVALAIEVLIFNFIEDGPVDKFLCAEPVIDNRSTLQILHACLHRAAFVSRSAVIDAEYREKLALVLDHHAGAELCRFDAAHFFFAAPTGSGPTAP